MWRRLKPTNAPQPSYLSAIRASYSLLLSRAPERTRVMNGALQVSKRRAEAKVVENPLDSKGACDSTPRYSNRIALAKEA